MTKAVSLARSVSDTGLLLDSDLAAIAALSGTTGLLKKDSANTWSLDTSSYLTGNQTLTFSGDATGTGTTAITITLANSGVSAGSYGSATNIPAITVDSKGRITSVTNTAVSIPSGSLTFTGDVTGNGTTGSSTSLTLASVGTAGTYTKVTTDAKGRVTSGGTLASGDLPTYTGTLTNSQITTALTFTPENLANKAVANGYASLDSTGKVPTAQLSGFVDQTKPNIRPTLNLDFANSKIVDSRITFTRSTTATYYDAQGVLQYAQPDQPRIDHDPVTGECRGLLIEEQRTNLRDYSDQIQNWSPDAVSVQPNAAIGPDGKMSAAKITALTNDGKISKQASNSAGTHIISVWLKSATGSSFNIGIGSYDVVASSQGFSTLTVTTEWQRFTQVVNCGANAAFYIGGASSFSNPESLYAWGYQVEAGTFATSYIPSTTTFTSRASSATYFDSTGILRLAGTNQPRYSYGYDTVSNKWVSQGLVLEAAATNLSVIGGVLQDASPTNVTVQKNVETAPDGTQTAARFSNTANTGSWVSTPLSLNAGTYTISFFAKAITATARVYFEFSNATTTNYPGFDIANNTAITGTWTSTPVGNGWYRLTYTAIWAVNGAINVIYIGNAGASPTAQTMALWGLQVESGSVATSYIPTYGATATRAADVSTSVSTTRAVDSAVIKSSEFTKLNSSTAGTLYGEGTIISGTALVGGAPALVALSNSVDRDTHRFILRRTNMTGDATYAGFNYRLATVINGTSYSIDYSAAEGAQPEWEDSAVHKTIFAVDTTSQQAYGDGISAGITSISIPSFDKLDQVEIGQGGSSSSWNGHIRKIAYYNKRLSNTQLQALTQ